MIPSWIVIEREGALWALPRASFAACERGPTIQLRTGATLRVDAIHALARELPIRELAPWLRRLLPSQIDALALWKGRPLAVLSAEGLPTWTEESPATAQREVS